jgi:hypothetical protein
MEFVYLGSSLIFLLVGLYWRRLYFLLVPSLFFCLPVMFNENIDQYFKVGVIIYFVIIFLMLFFNVLNQVFDG